ncbi:hypothetical protein CH373_06080 [Leptospira perolatii]|uniref:Uncharacterized protein n=1 Tax=Leptospira perolatii TaxID=2023191 RepID=A0A2M9ZP18_9LEPT|nr:hypothetical protein CH360_04810 [Leptospira perolatii]PJZ73731.1 hypothetical protein CH373_06080 [Leptospira perolatii]
MTHSQKIAALVGPGILVTTITETVNSHIWAGNTAAGIHFNGTVLFVAGLALVRSHNLWVRGWPTLLTLTGWFILSLGLFRMIAPELQLKAAQTPSEWLLPSITPMIMVGLYLTYKAYWPSGKTSPNLDR